MATPLTWEIELMTAVTQNDLAKVKAILSRDGVRWNGDLGRKDWNRDVLPLHRAAGEGRSEMIRALAESGVDLNSCRIGTGYNDGDRVTSLHYAVLINNGASVKLLLDLGADPSIHGSWKGIYPRLIPRDLAVRRGLVDIVRMFDAHAAKPPKPASVTSFAKMDSLSKIKQKPKKIQELEDAQNLQTEIAGKKEQVTKMEEDFLKDAKILKIEEERLNREKERLTLKEEELQTLKKDLKRLEENPIFVYTEDVKNQLDEIVALERSLKEVLSVDKEDKHSCPVCFLLPRQVFSCEECENWVCQECQKQLANCPSCRLDLAVKPLKRSKGMERLMGIV